MSCHQIRLFNCIWMQMDPWRDLREVHNKKKVVSSAGWITEPGSIACGAEVPAASPVPFVTPARSSVQHLNTFIWETRAFSPSFSARLPGLAHQLLRNDPSCPWPLQRRRQGMLGANGKNVCVSLSCPWRRSPLGRSPLPSHSPPGTGAALRGEPSEPRASYCGPETAAPTAGAGQQRPGFAIQMTSSSLICGQTPPA